VWDWIGDASLEMKGTGEIEMRWCTPMKSTLEKKAKPAQVRRQFARAVVHDLYRGDSWWISLLQSKDEKGGEHGGEKSKCGKRLALCEGQVDMVHGI
jgi:hypothetical protein